MATIGKFRTRSGHRFTSPADVLSLDVEAFSSVAGEEVTRVGFEIFPASGTPDSEEEWSRTTRFPNYSANSPLPGTGNLMAPVICYGVNLNANEWAPGWIQVIPYIITPSQPRKDLAPIWVLNDSDGGDRRGSSKTIWTHAQNGDDVTGNGTEALPYATLQKAIEEARNQPAGSTSSFSDMNCGGAVIMVEGIYTELSTSSINWHTDREWLTIQAGSEGATFNQDAGGDHFIRSQGVNGFSTDARLKLIGVELHSTIQLEPGSFTDCSMHGWVDQCNGFNPHYDAAKRWSVLYRQSPQAWIVIVPKPGTTPGEKYLSCFQVTGNTGLGSGFADIHDCRLTDWTQIAIENTSGSGSVCNALIEYQRYTDVDVWGFIDVTGNGSFDVTVPVPGTLRIDVTADVFQNGEVAKFERLVDLIGSDFQLQLTDFGGANDGQWDVTAAGVNFVELAVPGATADSPEPTARLWTWGKSSLINSGGVAQSYNQLVHPDILWMGSQTDAVYTNIASRNVEGAQGLFASGGFMERCVWHNVNDGGHEAANPINGLGWRDCVMTHCSLSGPVTFHANTNDSIIANNVWRSASNLPTDGVNGNLVTTNHTVLGSAAGTHGTAGPFYRYDTSVDPWSSEPLPEWLSSASWYYAEGYAHPDYWGWPLQEAQTVGVKVNVSAYDWGPPITGLTSHVTADTVVADANLQRIVGLSGSATGEAVTSSLLNNNTALYSWTHISAVVGDAELETITQVPLSSTAVGSSSASGMLSVIYGLSGSALGEGAGSGVLTTTEVELTGHAVGSAIVDASAPYIERGKPLPRNIMKQRIHNALVALIKNGTFHPVTKIDAATGQMTVDTTKTLAPQAVVLKETKSGYRLAEFYRRQSNASELSNWTWTALVEFQQEVACEVFEEAVIAMGIQIPKLAGVDDQRTLVARLVDSTYDHPPEQSPSDGTLVEFTFEIVSQFLRR